MAVSETTSEAEPVGRGLDRSTVVLAIRPVFVDRILDDAKWFEFRRRPLPAEVEGLFGWRTGTDGGVVFQAAVWHQFTRPAAEWLEFDKIGIDADALYRYTGGPDAPLTGIRLGLVRATPLTRFGWGRAPQSWRYAPDDWHDQIRALEGAA